VEKYGRARQVTDDNIIRRMRFACWITEATDTHSEYVIRIVFPRQQWLRERASILHLYVHCLSCINRKFYIVNEMLILNSISFAIHLFQFSALAVGFDLQV
jgi:hypothetical protein